MQTAIITHTEGGGVFDLLVTVGDDDSRGFRSVRAVELLTHEVWFDGEWNVDRLEANDPDAVPFELYLDVESAVVDLLAQEVAA